MNAYRPPKIRDTGLKPYLNMTKEKHDGLGYNDFVKFLSKKINTASIAKLFGVNWHTIDNWIDIYETEKAIQADQSHSVELA